MYKEFSNIIKTLMKNECINIRIISSLKKLNSFTKFYRFVNSCRYTNCLHTLSKSIYLNFNNGKLIVEIHAT